MIRKRSILLTIGMFITALTLMSCGGSGDGESNGSDDPQTSAGVTINGKIEAPAGSIAQIERTRSVLLAALDFVMSPAWAAVTGLTPVANATVELIQIDDDGNQQGSILESTTSDSVGAYSIELPAGLQPAGNLVLQIRNSSSQPALRALVSGNTVNIDPLSQFILDTMVDEPNVVMATLNVTSLQTLVNEVSRIDLDFSSISSLQDADTIIETSTEVSQLVDPQIEVLAAMSLLVGAWTVPGSDPLMLVLYTNGRYIHWEDCTDSQDGAGVEYGTYLYDGTVFSATPAVDQNGGCGLSEWQSFPVTVGIDQLSFGSGLDSGTLDRVWNNDENSIVGGWDIRSNATQPGALVFGADGNYIVYQPAGADAEACPGGGVEYGTYGFSGSSLTGSIILDQNNDCGLGDGTGNFVLSNVTVADNIITSDDGESDSLDRVEFSPGNFPDTSGDPEPEAGGQDLPVASITLDGDASDWAAVPAIGSDPQGDQDGNDATDLVSFKAAVDSSKFYLLLETSGDIALPHTPSQDSSHYEVGIHFFTDAQCGQELGFFIASNITSSFNGQNFHSLVNDVDFPTQFAYQGSFMETSFDLSTLPSEAIRVAFNPFIQSFGSNGSTLHDDFGGGVVGCYAMP